MALERFIKILQKDIVTDPTNWKDSEPGAYIKLPNRAKNVYAVLSTIAFGAAGTTGKDFLGEGWFWASHKKICDLTGHGQKTVQRAIKELDDGGFIEYDPAKSKGQKCYFKIKDIAYNSNNGGGSKKNIPMNQGEFDRYVEYATLHYEDEDLSPEVAARHREILKEKNEETERQRKKDFEDGMPF